MSNRNNFMSIGDIKANRQQAELCILRLQQSLELLADPTTWFARQHTVLIDKYRAVLLIWADVPNEGEDKVSDV